MKLEDYYDVVRPLGRGGFGRVLLVRDRTTKKLWAAKVLTAGRDVEHLRKFVREVKQLARYGRLGNVIRIARAFLNADPPFFLMEYAEGGALTAWAGRLAVPQTLTVMKQLLEVLTKIHAEGGFHRDIKPDNLLIMGDGASVLADFGLGNAPQCTVHFTMNAAGTLGYIAPEILGGSPFSPACDIFSAGATWFHLHTGRHPKDVPLPLRVNANESAHAWIDQCISAMTDPVPSRRPSAFQVLRTLQGALGNRHYKLPTTPPASRTTKAGWVVGGLALVVGLIVLASGD